MAISPNLMVMARAIEKASRSLIRDFNEVEKLQISVKGPGDFVSKADKRSEEIIVESLSKDRPDWGFLGEEGTDKKGKDAQYRWIIDPLDGTTNFLHGIPHWSVTIGLEKNNEIVAGMTFDPVTQEMFRAEKGGGAFMNNTRLRVSGRKDVKDTLMALNIGYLKNDPATQNKVTDWWKTFTKAGTDIRYKGGLALEMCYVAAGRFDGVLCNLCKPWDMAAGQIILKEAGGILTDLTLKPATFEKGEIFAANATLHAKYAELIGLKKA